MAKLIDSPFDDACYSGADDSPKLEVNGNGVTSIKGKFEVNGKPVVIGLGLDPSIVDPS